MNSKKELAGHVATMAGEILELAPHRRPRDASFRSDTALARRASRTCLFFDSHAVYALPRWHAMGINPPLFRKQAGWPVTRREGTLQRERSVGADSEAGTSPLSRAQSLPSPGFALQH